MNPAVPDATPSASSTSSPSTASSVSSGSPATRPPLKFTRSDRFIRELRRRVDAYFEQTGRRPRDCPRMYFKTATILAWLVSTYVLLMFVVTTPWLVVPLAVLLGLSIAAVGFNIQHDGGHKAYSERRWVNKVMALTLDLMGGSSYLWDWKHNSLHHTYPNIDGHDDDINVGLLARLSPHQKRLGFHRFQGIYLWVLYGFLAIKWHFVDDFYQIARGRIGDHKIPRPRGGDLAVFVAGKVVFFSLAFGLPLLLHTWWAALGVYAIAAFTSGVVLSVVFQLAHCVPDADFPAPIEEGTPPTLRMETDWAIHQVQTTVNFSRNNRVLSWFLGGLNYQIEHHLLARVCHVHYPDLSRIVKQVCDEFGIRYAEHRTFWSAVAAHFRWLVQMGRPVGEE